MLGPPCTGDAALDGRVSNLSKRLEHACNELEVPFLPVFPLLELNEVWRKEAEQGDGIHPDRRGYELRSNGAAPTPSRCC